MLQDLLERFGQRHYEIIEEGYDNVVAILGGKYVLRVARHADAAQRQQFEAALLELLQEHLPAPVELPLLQDYAHNPSYMVCTYVAGDVLSEAQIRALPAPKQAALGRALAGFIHWEATLDREAFRTRVAPLAIKRDQWVAYLNRSLLQFNDARYPALTKYARRLTSELTDRYPAGLADISDQIIHDDLYAGGNLVFNDRNELSGVIDFGGATLGTAAQEMRQMYRVSTHIVEACIAEYQRLGGPLVELELVRFWSVLSEVAVLCERIIGDRTNTRSFVRARGHLRRWFPEEDWTELDD